MYRYIYMCVCVCVCVFIYCKHMLLTMKRRSADVCLHICIDICVYVYIYVYKYVNVNACIYTCAQHGLLMMNRYENPFFDKMLSKPSPCYMCGKLHTDNDLQVCVREREPKP